MAGLDIDVLELLRGDSLWMIIPGGGGFGQPIARDVARGLEDLLDGLLSPEQARMLYGVVIQDGVVDAVTTRQIRSVSRCQHDLFTLGCTREYSNAPGRRT